MTFKEAVSAYTKAAQSYGPTSDAKPSPSQSNETHGTWYLRDRKGDQVARVSRSGVRIAGSNELARKKNGPGEPNATPAHQIGRAHVSTPVTRSSRMPSSPL